MSILPTVFVVFVLVALVERAHGQDKTSLPTAWYRGVSSDSSGSYLTAVANDGPIYYSHDSGVSWKVSNAPNPGGYCAVASSSTGQYLIAATFNATLVSSNYGEHFTTAAKIEGLSNSVAVSATGQYMVSLSTSNPSECVAFSNNYGASFTLDLGPNSEVSYCTGVSIDSSGTYVVLAVYSQGLWVSNNITDVSSWKLTYETETRINAIAFGGTSFYAGYLSSPASVVQSGDYGSSWTIKGSVSDLIQSIAVDSTGVNVLIASYYHLYLSQNSGTSYDCLYSASAVLNCAMNGNTTLAVFTAASANYADDFDVFVGNPCKKPFHLCFSFTLTSFPSVEMGIPSSAPTSNPDDTLSPGIIAAIILGSFAFCCILACIFIRLYFGRLLICWPANEPLLKEAFVSNA